jgi:hypothetical protein
METKETKVKVGQRPKVGSLGYYKGRLQVAGFVIGQMYNDFRANGHRRKMDIWGNKGPYPGDDDHSEQKMIVQDAMKGAMNLKVEFSDWLRPSVTITWIEPEFRLTDDEVYILVSGPTTKEKALQKIALEQRMLDWLNKVVRDSTTELVVDEG